MGREKTGAYNQGNEHNFGPFKREFDEIGFIFQGSEPAFNNFINKIVALNFPGIPDRKKSSCCHYSGEQKI